MTVIQHHTLLTVDPVVQYGAIAALQHQSEVETLRQLYKERRDYTVQQFSNVDGISPIHSRGGFYITLNCRQYMAEKGINMSLELAERIMQSEYVATVPGSDFGLPHTLRLSFSSNKYKCGIDRLVRFFKC